MSKSTLYDIANEFEKSLDNLLDHDDSDLINEIESIEGEFKSKSANVAKYIRNLEHLASGIKEIESNQKHRRNSLEKKIARLKDYLRINFEKTNTEKIISQNMAFFWTWLVVQMQNFMRKIFQNSMQTIFYKKFGI